MIQLTSEITVEKIQAVGDDAMIAHAAMVSTRGKLEGALGEPKTEGLINYLMKHRHGTPFEHGLLTVRVSCPAKVWWEWVRHRIGWSYNLESSRYKQLDPVFYIPPRARWMIRPVGFKSARPEFASAVPDEYALVVESLRRGYEAAYKEYQYMLDLNLDRGLAMLVLGQGIYFSGYATANPRSIMAFLELRTDHPEAKRPSKPLHEIVVAAKNLEAIFAEQWPITYRAWADNGRAAP